ncbi:MAG: carboxymuconolactone decarboxylase family protein [Bradymonadia bacterium]|jgi:alkyl hydroperoxide reductase subunit D
MGPQLDALREQLPEAARDLKLNLSAVLGDGALSPEQRWGVACAAAFSTRDVAFSTAMVQDARAAGISDATIDDARAAAVLMGMNNVYYRFRHFMKDAGRTTYGDKPARLRMQRIAKPAGDKALFELMCLAVSAIGGCELCVQSHELVVLQAGLTDDQVHDAVRVAATVNGVATARAIQA